MKKKSEQVPSVGRHIRFPIETDRWLEDYARQQEYRSVPELVCQIVREFKQEMEKTASAQAA